MAKPILVITGDKKLNKKLKRLAGKDAKAVIRKSARPALKPVLQEARNNVPVRTGTLRRNIKIKALPRSRRSVGARVTSGTGKSLNKGEAYYGSFVEFGTKHMKPRRFMKRAADKKQKHSVRIYGEQIGQQLKKLAKNG